MIAHCFFLLAFVVAIFKLCDVWTPDISYHSYLVFLRKLQKTLTIPTLRRGKVKGVGRAAVRRMLRSKEEIIDLKKGHHRLREEKKIAAILLAYSTELRRWEMNSDLAVWLSRLQSW